MSILFFFLSLIYSDHYVPLVDTEVGKWRENIYGGFRIMV